MRTHPLVTSEAVPRSKKPVDPDKPALLSVIVDGGLMKALDDEAERQSKQLGFKVRRSNVVVRALREWLADNRPSKKRG